MDSTTNLGFKKPTTANTFKEWLDATNDNMAKIDAMPIPVDYGANDKLSYIKFSNGKVFMWGSIAFGKNYPCTSPWASSYASNNFSITYPISLVSSDVVVLPHVMADINPDTFCLTRSATSTVYTGCFTCAISETQNNKTLNILIIGRWK